MKKKRNYEAYAASEPERVLWQQTAEIILQLLLPRRCPVCDTILKDPRKRICPSCFGTLPWNADAAARCMRCSRPLTDERAEYCDRCAGAEPAFGQAFAVFLYEKGMRKSILRMKFENRREYLDFYAQAMQMESRDFIRIQRPQAILPVPMYPKKVRRRGYDQCRILAEKYAALTGLPLIADSVIKVKDTRPQKGLSRQERARNLRGAFKVKNGTVLPPDVLILDDIFTTGSTADEMSRVLQKNGVERVSVLALSITP